MAFLPVFFGCTGIDKTAEICYTVTVSRRDGIGRRDGLKITNVIFVVGKALISGFFRYSDVLTMVW